MHNKKFIVKQCTKGFHINKIKNPYTQKDEAYKIVFFNNFHALIANTVTYLILWKIYSQIPQTQS